MPLLITIAVLLVIMGFILLRTSKKDPEGFRKDAKIAVGVTSIFAGLALIAKKIFGGK